jgi:hypothetical protein
MYTLIGCDLLADLPAEAAREGTRVDRSRI